MSNHMKIALFTRKMQIITNTITASYPLNCNNLKKRIIVGLNMEKLETLSIAGGNIKLTG